MSDANDDLLIKARETAGEVGESEVLAELKRIDDWIINIPAQLDASPEEKQRQIGFLSGRAFELTKQLEEHPQWWQRECWCMSCQGYADE